MSLVILSAVWLYTIWQPAAVSSFVSADSAASEPDTVKFLSRSICARPLMLIPPIPIKCTWIGLLKLIWYMVESFLIKYSRWKTSYNHIINVLRKNSNFIFTGTDIIFSVQMSYGLLRAAHSHNPAQYSHIVKHSLHFYANTGRVMNPYACASASRW